MLEEYGRSVERIGYSRIVKAMPRSFSAWGLVALAYVLVTAWGVTTYLFLTSVYGSDAFGVWRPPQTETFRRWMGLGGLAMIIACIVTCGFVVVLGSKWTRIAIIPAAIIGSGFMAYCLAG